MRPVLLLSSGHVPAVPAGTGSVCAAQNTRHLPQFALTPDTQMGMLTRALSWPALVFTFCTWCAKDVWAQGLRCSPLVLLVARPRSALFIRRAPRYA